MEAQILKDDWRCAMMISGGQCVTTGLDLISTVGELQLWLANNSDFLIKVLSILPAYIHTCMARYE